MTSIEENNAPAKRRMTYCRCCDKPKKIMCNTCGKKKKPEDFHTGKKICKVCRCLYNQKRYQQRKLDQILAKSKMIVKGLPNKPENIIELTEQQSLTEAQS